MTHFTLQWQNCTGDNICRLNGAQWITGLLLYVLLIFIQVLLETDCVSHGVDREHRHSEDWCVPLHSYPQGLLLLRNLGFSVAREPYYHPFTS